MEHKNDFAWDTAAWIDAGVPFAAIFPLTTDVHRPAINTHIYMPMYSKTSYHPMLW